MNRASWTCGSIKKDHYDERSLKIHVIKVLGGEKKSESEDLFEELMTKFSKFVKRQKPTADSRSRVNPKQDKCKEIHTKTYHSPEK